MSAPHARGGVLKAGNLWPRPGCIRRGPSHGRASRPPHASRAAAAGRRALPGARAQPGQAGQDHAWRPGGGGGRRAGRLPRPVPQVVLAGRPRPGRRLPSRHRAQRLPHRASRPDPPRPRAAPGPVDGGHGVRGGERPDRRGQPRGDGRAARPARPAARGNGAPLLPRPDRRPGGPGHGRQPRHGQVRHLPRPRRPGPDAQGGPVSIDDRIRTATAATAATVREISPLALPDDLPGTTLPPARPHSRRSRRAGLTRPAGRGPRRLGTWLVPLAAAAAVIALAATLVAVRDLPGVRASGSTPAVPGPAVPGLPRYGAVLTTTLARIPPKFGSGDVPVGDLSVIDTHTGQRVALVKHPTNFGFTAVSGAADDRTFALAAVSIGLQPQPGIPGELAGIWDFYLLRIAPGSARPATLTRLSIPVQPDDAVIDGFALSPDGRTLAVMEWCTVKPSC